MNVSIESKDSEFSLLRDGKPLLTPKKQPLSLSTRALAESIAMEWENPKYTPKTHPLSSIAFTAIDVVHPERAAMEAAMLAYAETDLLCYRSENADLRALEDAQWGKAIEWIQKRYECRVEVTTGIIPVEQPPLTTQRFTAALAALSDMELSALSVLVQAMGSLLLGLMVYGGGAPAEEAFALSRLDEDFQSARWGVDELAAKRAEELKKDTQWAGTFLELLRQ